MKYSFIYERGRSLWSDKEGLIYIERGRGERRGEERSCEERSEERPYGRGVWGFEYLCDKAGILNLLNYPRLTNTDLDLLMARIVIQLSQFSHINGK